MTWVRHALLVLLLLAEPVWSQSLTTIVETGDRGQRLNLVMLSEGYTSAELASNKFKNDATTISNALLGTEPFKSYRTYFNVYGISIASAQSGADQGSAGTYRDTYFNATFNTSGIDRLLTIDGAGYSRAQALLDTFVPEYDIVLVVVNDSKYGGSGGAIAVTSTNVSAPEIAIHEIGHSFAGLGDEYDYAGSTSRETPNTTQQTQRSLIKWHQWINAATPVPTPETSSYANGLVGLFEGAAYAQFGWHRPTLESKMKNLGEPFYAVNEEAIVLAIYDRISPITSSYPVSSTVTVDQPDLSLTFNVDGPSPASTSPAIKVSWTLDGQIVSGQTGRTLYKLSTSIGNGSHTLRADVSDPTLKVRNDPYSLLKASRTWTLNLSNQGPAAPANVAAALKPNGSVDLTWTDKSDDEAGFMIERVIGLGAYAEIGRVGANATSYNDATTTPGSITRYRVRGVNAYNSSLFGPASSSVTVTPEVAPSPLSAPADVTVLRGQMAKFTVQAYGIPLRFQWRRNGTAISAATKATYTITSAQTSHVGSYDCVVSNSVGSFTSNAASLVVNVPAGIAANPVSATVFYDQPVTLNVQASGTLPMAYQWRKAGIDIVGANASSFTINAPDANDAALYDCRVSNSFGAPVISKAAKLTVLSPPLIVAPPASVTIDRGQTATFTIAAKGTATLTYQWRKNGSPISGATKTKLSVVSAKDSDAAGYDCIVSNGYGRVTSTPATLAFTGVTTSDYRLVGDRAGSANWRWVKRFGGTENDSATALAVMPGGSVLFGGGSLSSGIKLDALPASNLGGYVGWLQADGKALAIRALNYLPTEYGTTSVSYPASPFMDYLAALPISGRVAGVVELGQFTGNPPASPQQQTNEYIDLVPEVALQFSSTERLLAGRTPDFNSTLLLRRIDNGIPTGLGGALNSWTRSIGSPSSTNETLAMLRQDTGDILIAGRAIFNASGKLAFQTLDGLPAVELSGTANQITGFVACYNDLGELLWARAYGSWMRSLVLDASGVLWVAGDESGRQAVLLKLNPANGNELTRFLVQGAYGLAAAVGSGGDVAMLVRMDTAITNTAVGSYSVARYGYAVTKFSSAGALQWVLPVYAGFYGNFTSFRARLASGANGELYAAFTLADGSVEFGGMTPFVISGRKTDAFIAAISEAPRIVTPPAHQIVPLGQPLNLSVTADGLAGAIKYQWLKDGKILDSQTASTLSIAITKLTDAGSYSCKVTGNGGTTESAKAIVNIVDTTAHTLKAPTAKSLDLSVTARGTGLSYTWWKNGTRIFNIGGFGGTSTNKLHISAMSPAFADSYVCKVVGPGGTLDVPFTTEVMYPPVFTTPTVPDAVVSGGFLLQLSASDAVTYKVNNLPPGLIFDPKTGRITGKPTTPGSKIVTVTATNAAGTTNPAMTFTITVADMAAYAKGSFQALITKQAWNVSLGGLVTFTLSSSGVPTGTLRIAGATYKITGRVETSAVSHEWTFNQRIARTGKAALLVNLIAPSAQDGELTGTIALDAVVPDAATVSGRQTVWNATLRPATAYAGTFNANLALPPGLVGNPNIPQGAATMKTVVTANSGLCSWSGKLGDGTSFSGSSPLWPSGAIPTWVALYANFGSLQGAPVISSPGQTGSLDWTRNASGTGPSWSGVSLSVNGTLAP